ncbi:putative TPP enzyme family protein [Teratosphaeria destructans]|uniref:TPP enzyme family protein n=1 Tax=Teratosphaeria destructans TaxID=418781 RepID=A0A9W7VYV3_9PEZI|nr:putative TPP enzyme family protein [Teratosphaeria destructans]
MHKSTANPESTHHNTRVLSVVAATVISLSSGTNYAYSAWAPQYAHALDLSATQINLIGAFGNIGMYAMGIPGGILIDSRGPRWGVFAGVICLAIGYTCLRAALLAGKGAYGVPMLCIFTLLTGLGSCMAFGAAIKVSATNWPRHRGTATAFPLSAFGLSALFYTSIGAIAFPGDTAGYLLLLAVGCTVMLFVGGLGLQIVQGDSGGRYRAVAKGERPGLARRSSSKLRRTSTHARASSGSVGEIGTREETSSLVSSTSTSSTSIPPPDPDVDEHGHTLPTDNHRAKPDVTGFQLLRTPKFWQLFILLGLLCGVGLMTINNIGNNALTLWHHFDDTASHDFLQKRQLMHVSILSLCSFLGRLSSGIGSDWLIHHQASRFWTLIASACIFGAAQIAALTIENPNRLFILSSLTGLAYGALFGVYPALVADAFGPSGMGINWAAMTMAPVLSANFFNLAYGAILDAHSHSDGESKGGGQRVCLEGKIHVTFDSNMYTASFAFFEALWQVIIAASSSIFKLFANINHYAKAGVTHAFVNLGSDHPSIIEAIVKGQNEKPDAFPRIITCPNEMVALSMADGYARLTNQPQAVIIHVDVGTQGLGAAVHNASCGRAPVLIFAGLSPYTIEGEYRGSRTEYIHWIQDVPDQKQIVSQYCRYTGEIKRGRNVKQIVNRALSFATSEPKGPVYLVGAREAMEEEIEPCEVDQAHWRPVELGGLTAKQLDFVSEALVQAQEPLLITGYSGRNHKAVDALVELADTVPGLRVLDTGGSDMCFPADHPAWLGLRYGVEENIKTADFILLLDVDVPWIPTQCKPKAGAKIVHIDVDPLKQQMPVFYVNAVARYRADAETSITQIAGHLKATKHDILSSQRFAARQQALQQSYQRRLDTIAAQAQAAPDATFGCSYLISQVRHAVPRDTIFAVEAVTNTAFVADQIQATIPGGKGKGKFVVQIVGDGTYLFSVPGSVYWIAERYGIAVLTIVLNNQGWNAPRKSLLLVHPDGEGSKVDNRDLNISFAPTPDYAGIAKAASGGKAWAGHAGTVEELARLLPQAVEAVKGGVCAVLDAHLDGPQGKFGGGKSVTVG